MKRLLAMACMLVLVGSSCLVSQEAQVAEPVANSPSITEKNAPVQVKTSTWLIVRHAEKDSKELLTEEGKQRAEKLKKLASLFGVNAVYATDYPRTQNTGKPTADALGIKVEKYAPMPDAAWFKSMKGKYAGQTVLIVGHSNTVDKIVAGLGGAGKISIGHDDYDNLFVVIAKEKTTELLQLKY